MAQLKFDGIQPVCFGGRDCMPKTNTELRLRLQGISFKTDAETEKADKIIAECFPDDQEYVEKFLNNEMTPYEKQELRAYLVSGPSAIRMINKAISDAMAEATKGDKQ